jgi:hypothetical protein
MKCARERPDFNLGEFGKTLVEVGAGLMFLDCFIRGEKSCLVSLLRRFMLEVA